MIYLVLGMHKSGTTLVSRLMQDAGIEMGVIDRGEISYDEGEKYEDPWASLVTKAVLRVPWRHNSLRVPPEKRSEDDARLITIARQYVAWRQESFSDWGFKEPRASLCYGFWRALLPEHRVVMVVRRPEEIWLRYMRRFPWYRIIKSTKRGVHALRAWCVYNQSLIDALRTGDTQYLAVYFDRLVTENAEMNRLQRFIGRGIVDSRQTELYRNKRMKPKGQFVFRFHKALCKMIYGHSVDSTWRDIAAERHDG